MLRLSSIAIVLPNIFLVFPFPAYWWVDRRIISRLQTPPQSNFGLVPPNVAQEPALYSYHKGFSGIESRLTVLIPYPNFLEESSRRETA